MRKNVAALTLLLLAVFTLPVSAGSIALTKHNLSSSAPLMAPQNTVYSTEEDRICVFCHTPHNAKSTTALWNHELSPDDETYIMYGSTAESTDKWTLEYDQEDIPKRPTGSSRLCLSCHDGTVAIGVGMQERDDALDDLDRLQSYAVIGADLSNDHPISIPIVEDDNELTYPPPGSPIKLEDGLIQCSTCHDPHNGDKPLFQRMEFDRGVLCLECHLQDGWNLESAHRTATDKYWTDPEGVTKSVADWGCFACHEMMGANAEYLLQVPEGKDPAATEEVCFKCHGSNPDGSEIIPGVPDITGEFNKTFSHPVQDYSGIHWPKEENPPSKEHVECEDCHDPHYGQAGGRTIGDDRAGGMLAGIKAPRIGPSSYAGTEAWNPPDYGAVDIIEYEYELCLKCHGTESDMILSNQHKQEIDVYFNPKNQATHGCIVPGNNRNRNPKVLDGLVPEFRATWTNNTTIACSDCHGNDTTSSDRINGPHGSDWPWLMRKSGNPDPMGNDVVCYLCHDPLVYGKYAGGGGGGKGGGGGGTPQASPENQARTNFKAHTVGGHWRNRDELPPEIPNVGCFGCHGDFSYPDDPVLDGYTPGGLHGANSGRKDRPDNTTGYHFLNGFSIVVDPSADLFSPGATVTCGDYTVNGYGCGKHGEGTSGKGSTSYTRGS